MGSRSDQGAYADLAFEAKLRTTLDPFYVASLKGSEVDDGTTLETE